MKTVVLFRFALLAATQLPFFAAAPVRAPERVTYKRNADRDLLMTITRPPGWAAADCRPAIIFFYNGGWKEPGAAKPQFEEQTRYFAARGMVVGQADYREKSKEGPTSSKCVEDIFSGVRWLRRHAAELGVDPRRIAAAGGSGSIHLPAAALHANEIDPSGEEGSIDPLPGAMFLFNPDPDVLDPAMRRKLLAGGAAKPVRTVPPMVIYYGSRDAVAPFLDEFVAQAGQAGLPVEKFVGDGGVHGFFKFSPGLEQTAEHMDRRLCALGLLDPEPRAELPHKAAPPGYEARILATQQKWLERHDQLARERSPVPDAPPAQKPPAKPEPAEKPAPPREPAIELSPFVVSAAQDTGYVAQDTLSGTRTRTPLKDVANAIGVFTRDFIDDLGAASEKDVLAYSASVVPEVGDQSANGRGNSLTAPETFGYRLRGQAATRTRNYFDALVPPDTYNLGRFEEARGPNAMLFGMGGAGGILNHSTKRSNLAGRQTTAAFSVGRFALYRGELDHNHVLRPGQLAMRLNALAQNSASPRPYAFSRQRRATLAATWKISPRLSLHVEAEAGTLHNNDGNSFGTSDSLSLWLDRGRPTQAARVANPALGLALSANQQRVTLITNDGSVRNFQQTLQTTTDAARLGAVILNPSLMTHDPLLRGPGNENFIDYRAGTAYCELQPARHLFVELAADYQASDYRLHGTVNSLLGDPATTYRDGAVNPHAGALVFDTSPVRLVRKEILRTLRATASYTLQVGRWGRHHFGAMAQENTDRLFRLNTQPVLLGSPFNATPSNARNRIFARSYVTSPVDVSQYAVASWRLIPAQMSVVMDPGGVPSVFRTGWVNIGNSFNDDWADVRSYLASSQSFFFSERLVASLGYRRDERYAYTRPPILDPITNAYFIDYSTANLARTSAAQSSIGLVFHATRWLSLLYNQSQNAQIPTGLNTLIPDGSLFPLSRGRGRDAGFTLSLLGGRVFARLACFETSMLDASKGFMVVANVVNRNSRILDTMVTDGTLTSAQADALRFRGADPDLLDRRTTGFELAVTANPTATWRMTLNASQGKAVETNMLKRTRALMPGMLAVWRSARQTSVTAGSGAPTIAQETADFLAWFAGTTAVEDKSSLGDREWQVKFFHRYNFTPEWIKGWYVGGGWRYQSAPIIGARAGGAFFTGESSTEVDVLAGYQTRATWFGRRTRLMLQFNGGDLLQRRNYLSVRRNPDGILAAIRIVEPESYRLQAKLTF
jgi:acetyl esterase/lipase/outer membrane receptor protein involved in Fe transport